jgi:isoleucyl-tRNA synthetase
LVELIKEEVNVKEISFGRQFRLDIKITPELKEEGIIREIIRHIQEMRKEAGLRPREKVLVGYLASSEIKKILDKHRGKILTEAKISDLKQMEDKFDLEKEIKVEKEKIKLAIKKIDGTTR